MEANIFLSLALHLFIRYITGPNKMSQDGFWSGYPLFDFKFELNKFQKLSNNSKIGRLNTDLSKADSRDS